MQTEPKTSAVTVVKWWTFFRSLLLFFALFSKSLILASWQIKKTHNRKRREMRVLWPSWTMSLSQASLLLPSLQSQLENKQSPLFQLSLEPAVDIYQGSGHNKEEEVSRECARESNLSGTSLLALLLSCFFPPGRLVFFQRFSRKLETPSQGAWGQRDTKENGAGRRRAHLPELLWQLWIPHPSISHFIKLATLMSVNCYLQQNASLMIHIFK